MDTYSLYFAFLSDSFEEAVRPELRDEFQTCQKVVLFEQMERARAWAVQAGVRGCSGDCSLQKVLLRRGRER